MPEILKSDYDPTGTTHLRNEFSEDIFNRFDRLRKDMQVLYRIHIYDPCPPSLTSGDYITEADLDVGNLADRVVGDVIADEGPFYRTAEELREEVRKEAERLIKLSKATESPYNNMEIVDANNYSRIIQDALFLRSDEYLLAHPELFVCLPNDKRTEVFLNWLEDRLKEYVLDHFFTLPEAMEILTGADISEVNWTDTYIDQAYRLSVYDAVLMLQQEGVSLETPSKSGRLGELIEDGVTLGLLSAGHAEMLKSLRRGTYEEVVGLSVNVKNDISKIVSRGLSAGHSNDIIAGNIDYLISHEGTHNDIVDTLGRRYSTFEVARQIARTEIVRTYNEGLLETYSEFGVTEVFADIEFQFQTQGDAKVCPICRGLEGTVYTIEEARGVIPIHRNCRCSWIPRFKRR